MSSPLPSQGAPLIIPLWDETPPNQIPSQRSEYVDAFEDREIIKNVQTPTIEVRLPASPAKPTPAVLIIPGGGYQCLAYHWEGTDVAGYLNAKGIAAVVLKHRLPHPDSCAQPHLTPMLDAERALRLIRHHANEWKIDQHLIGVLGFSAGGHLAATLATQFTSGKTNPQDPINQYSSRPDFQALLYPIINLCNAPATQSSLHCLLGESQSAAMRSRYSANQNVTSETPPCFLIHATDDQTVAPSNSLSYYKALKEKNIDVEIHLYPKGGHGFALARDKGRLSRWPELLVDWIQELPNNPSA
ncbi:alpha/beta hydrolase [Puniceicoccaceae bacterium K14]|nr:alpha/beta hydrolase [Puniceicoccaceae bacterium K14]